jgi:hypothetical protein
VTAAEYRRRCREYCRRVADGEHWFSCDAFGRVHTPLTALPKELRRCLSVNGQRLVGLDRKNSQPLLLGVFARQYYRKSRMGRSRLLNKSFGGRKSPYCTQEVRAMSGRAMADLPANLSDYIAVCERGGFYESLMTDKERAKGDGYRDRLKRRFYRVLFGRSRSRNACFRNELRGRFKARYPSVWAVLRALKRKNYKHSAHVLQNYESTLFIDLVCGRVLRERPDVTLYTIHDSVLTTPDAAAYVRGVILDEFAKLGVTLALREERYR